MAAYTPDARLRAAAMCFIHSVRAQTYENWELQVVHDGPSSGLKDDIVRLADPRVSMVETPVRLGNFGHPHRQAAIDCSTGDFLCLGNADNYLAPVYLEWLLHELLAQQADFVYCDMVHSHYHWKSFTTTTALSFIDLASWMASRKLFNQVRWDSMADPNAFAADGYYALQLIARAHKVVKVPALLLVHN